MSNSKMPGAGPGIPHTQMRERLLLEVAVLAVFALLPFVHDVAWKLRITLFVESDVAENRLERTLFLHCLGNGFRIIRSSCLGGIGDDLRCRICIERIGFRLEALCAELLDELLVG